MITIKSKRQRFALHLPTEYHVTSEYWDLMLGKFKDEGDRNVSVAEILRADIGNLLSNMDFSDVCAEVAQVDVIPEGRFVEIEFKNTKTGMALLYLAMTDKTIGFIPIVNTHGIPEIQRISMCYLPQ